MFLRYCDTSEIWQALSTSWKFLQGLYSRNICEEQEQKQKHEHHKEEESYMLMPQQQYDCLQPNVAETDWAATAPIDASLSFDDASDTIIL
jgi:4-alpha-glucanotransferase